MSSRFIMPFANVGSGIKPSSGAKLFFFELDGVTPKNTFSDQLASPTANTNPVISDSNGVFGDIYINGSYKVTLQNKNGTQIFGGVIVDELTGVNDLSIPYIFDTVASMKASTIAFPIGKVLETVDYYGGWAAIATAPRGGAKYEVVAGGSGVDDGGKYHDLASGLQVILANTDSVNIKQYGAKGDLIQDDQPFIQSAISGFLGKKIIFPSVGAGLGYLVNDELLIPFNGGSGTELIGESRVNTKIRLGAVSNKALIRLSASRCTISNMRLEGSAGQTGNQGIKLAPQDEAQTTLRVAQDRNLIENMVVGGTFDRGMSFITGPDVGGGDSSCYFNTIFNVDFRDNVLGGIVLTDGVNAGSSPSNRNRIMFCEFSGNMNYGIFNEGADTTLIFRCDFEGVDFGTLPFTNASAVVVAANAPTSGKDNANVTIESCSFETCTRDIDNSNARTMIITSNYDTTKSSFTAQPMIALGGVDFSTTTQRLPGYRFQTNNQEAGLPNSKPVFDSGVYLDASQSPLENYEADTPTTPAFGSFTPYLADNSNSNGEGQVYSKQVGAYTRIGNRCFFDIRLRTTSTGTLTGSETAKICGLPFTSKNLTDYTASALSGFAQLLNLSTAGSVTGLISANQTCIALRKWTTTSGTSNVTITEWSSDGDLAISGSYEIED